MIALKLDADTYRGTKEGLPRILDLLGRESVKCSAFFSFGPDESGRAVKRIFTKKGFLKKMFRTNAAKLYGFRTMLYGTLLPAPEIGRLCAAEIKQAALAGHDCGVHAWSHVRWQDDLDSMDDSRIRFELNYACESFRRIMGRDPSGFAAPAWKINKPAFDALLEKNWSYFSICRGAFPALPVMGSTVSRIPEFPTTLPTLDEILGWDGMTPDKALEFLIKAPRNGQLNVYTFHTEAEGMAYFDFFAALLAGWKKAGFNFVTLEQAVRIAAPFPEKRIIQGELPGRAGLVATI